MTYRIIVKPSAEMDIEESFLWYEEQMIGLGHRFKGEVDRTLATVAARPLTFGVVQKETRRAILHRFPHSIFFLLDGDTVVITACVHHRRHPRVWRSRR